VQAFYNDKLRLFSAETANGYFMILRSFFKWAIDVAHIRRQNPCDNVDLTDTDFRGRRFKDFCSETQRDRLIKTCLDAARVTMASGEPFDLSGFYIVFTSNLAAAEILNLQHSSFTTWSVMC
jgi:hypothetical protein